MISSNISNKQLEEEAGNLEMEMMQDMYSRMTGCCHRKCIGSTYKDSELTKGESICLDRCVAKYLEIYDRVGKTLSQFTEQQQNVQSKNT
ncbi:hypothetical protein GJ496_011272 [Pomphorhynchus laevis]|nr:hypothetical protein GJ496_011272 [Pomphorhynchus laevis]